MRLPPFNDEGDLAPGVYQATLDEVISRFGNGSVQRVAVGDRLRRIYELVRSTGHLARFIVFGSFVTAKEDPNDVDIVLVMNESFDERTTSKDAVLPFYHEVADSHFGASIFWVRRPCAFDGEQAMVEYWQNRREGGRRGIVEIVEPAND